MSEALLADPGHASRGAADTGARVGCEDGLQTACDALESLLEVEQPVAKVRCD